MKHVVSFSSGLSSALTVERVLQRYEKDGVGIVFMDTLFEDEDNYRFMAECEERWHRTITVLRDGRTPYEVAAEQHIIPNQKIAPCTYRLKITQFIKYLLGTVGRGGPLTIHVGYDFTEVDRCEATVGAYGEYGWEVDFPLLWKPYELRPYPQVVRSEWGIEPPRMYALGYTHANCGGRCCKQGQGDWMRTLVNFPERYQAIETWEQEQRQKPGRENYAIMKREGPGRVTIPMTLKEFRERYEVRTVDQPLLFTLDTQSPCVHCGVGL